MANNRGLKETLKPNAKHTNKTCVSNKVALFDCHAARLLTMATQLIFLAVQCTNKQSYCARIEHR